MNIETIEKYYKNKFGEDICILSAKQKIVSKIENLEDNIKYETKEEEGYEIRKSIRNLSLFSNKCKYCEKSTVKENDRINFIKHNCCERCYILYEEQRKNGR
jgi:hypothetical protein